MSHGLLGSMGDIGAERFLDALRTLRCSGTLALCDDGGVILLQIAKGQVEASFKLGTYGRLEATGQTFHLYPHEPADEPRLPARSSTSRAPLLRALPRLAPAQRLPIGAVDLPRLLESLHERAFNGVLSYVDGKETAVALLVEGTIRAAVHERGDQVHTRGEALRALQRAGREGRGGVFELEAIDPLVARPLAALALGRAASAEAGATFSGLEVDTFGYRFFRNGQAFLRVLAEPVEPIGRYALDPVQAARAPELALPSEPPGWEDRRYALTLRGQDALNPMTDLNMAFRTEHGRDGQRVLEVLGRGRTLADAALDLEFELSELKPWLERLEAAGMIREQRS